MDYITGLITIACVLSGLYAITLFLKNEVLRGLGRVVEGFSLGLLSLVLFQMAKNPLVFFTHNFKPYFAWLLACAVVIVLAGLRKLVRGFKET